MTEVVSLNEPDQKVVVERHYEAGPPEGLEIVETGDTIAITKEEEWVSKKTREVVNTKQIETRIKRQVVLEDGKVVEDSGPMVTTNTTEDTETQQHHQTELKKLGEDDKDEKKALGDKEARKEEEEEDQSKWIVVPNPDGLVREVNERRVISREETEDTKETEDIQHFGDITDEAFISAVNSGKSDIRPVLKAEEINHSLVSTGAQLINESHRSKKVTDTEETKERSSVLPDGRIISETRKTTEHEEVKDDELPEGLPDQNQHRESHQRFFKSRDQEEIDYVADGVKVGHDMRFRGETTEAERRGDGIDDPDWDSLSARAKRRQNVQQSNRQVQRVKALENGAIPTASPLDRKDALTKKPLDFDKEEETRKTETSKWLEHHFGSESRSSRDSLDEIEDEPEHTKQTKTSFFNVTIKSQPTPQQTDYSTTKVQQGDESHRYYTSIEKVPEEEYQSRQTNKHFQGIKEWNEREKDIHINRDQLLSSPVIFRENSSPVNYLQERYQRSPPRDYRTSPQRETSPIAPQRKRTQERPQTLIREENTRFDSGYRTLSRNEIDREPLEEPPPDYSPTTPPRAVTPSKKLYQKTRFAADTPPSPPPQPTKVKSGNIIGQSIRKLVGKIRSASAERKAKQQQRAKRSPSPTYKKGNVIDNIHESQNGSLMQNGGSRRSGSPGPVHRYYLGEDPFGGSIYGRENKYDGVRPARPSRKHENRVIQEPEEYRSHSTLGRFGKSFNRIGLTPPPVERNSQTLPRHLSKHEKPIRLEKSDRSNSTINVSFINTVSAPNKPIVNGGPAKPARTYRSNLSRSKSFNVDLDSPHLGMNKFNPQLPAPTGLKSPGLISSISRSQRDLTVDQIDNGKDYMVSSRFARNGNSDNKRIFLKDLRQRAPELYKTLHEEEKDESWNAPLRTSTPLKNSRNVYNGDMYEPPTRLRESPNFTPSGLTSKSVIRRGSNSSNDYSETYHTTTRNDDPVRPSVTNTVKSFSKKTVPTNDGRNYHTIESTETKSITKSRYHGDYDNNHPVKYYENKMNGISSRGPVVIEVRNNYK